MTAANVLFLALIFVVLFGLQQSWRHLNTCRYCGEVNGHDPHCPYGNVQ